MIRRPKECEATPLLLGVWFALGSGIAEALYQWLRRDVLGRPTLVSVDAAWMAPLMNLGWIGLPALTLWWLWRRPGRCSLATAVTILGTVGVSGVTLLNGRIHWAASVLLALGVAVQLGRAAGRWPAGFLRLVRVSTVGFVLVVGGLAGGLPLARGLAERQALDRLAIPAENAPNVLLLVIDTARWFEFSVFDSTLGTTPALLRWSAEGTSFTRAFSSAPWTLPSHGTIMTGRWPFEISADWKVPVTHRVATLAEALAGAGYATGGFVANLAYCSREYGLARGFHHYFDFRKNLEEFAASSAIGRRLFESGLVREVFNYHDFPGRSNARVVNDRLLTWLDGLGERRFFAFVNYFDAHEPFVAPPEYLERFGPTAARRPDLLFHVQRGGARPHKETAPPEEIQAELNAYRGALAYIDSEIDRLLRELARRGRLDHTLVIVTADHGEQFGEHGLFEHGNSFYPEVLQVPLALRLPGTVPADRKVNTPVSLRDLAATILDLTGGSVPFPLPGTSLAPLWSAHSPLGSTNARAVFADFRTEGGKPRASLISEGWHYQVLDDGAEELYHLDQDPREVTNLIATPQGQALASQLRIRMDSVRAAAGAGRQRR